MKLFIASGLVIAAISLGSVATASTPSAPVVEERAVREQSAMVTIIDGVTVPFDLQINIQMLYQGHAVTQVSVVNYNGEKAYRLRVDRDSIPDDYDSIHLYYDMDWRLIDEKDISRPKKPEPAPEPAASPEEAPAPAPPPPAEPATEAPAPPEAEAATGGRGGGDEPNPDNSNEGTSEGNDSTDTSGQDEEAVTDKPEAEDTNTE